MKPGRDRPDTDFDADELEAGIAKEMSEHGLDRETAKGLVKDHLAATLSKSAHTREYLEAFHGHARAQLPDWQAQLIHQAAMPSSGGAAGRRVPVHSEAEMVLFKRLTPELLADSEDESLSKLWSELDGHRKLAAKKGLPTDDYDRGASFLGQEMTRRGIEFDRACPMGKSAVELGTVAARLRMLPDEIVLAPAAGLSASDDGVSLSYHPMLGGPDLVEAALVDVGIYCKSTSDEGLEGSRLLYDVVLRRSGAPVCRPEDPGAIELSALPRGLEPVSKAMAEKRLIWYVIAEPGEEDTYGHIITAEEVEDAAHRFMLGPRRVFLEHGDKRGLNEDDIFPRELTGKAITVESAITPCAIDMFFGDKLPKPILARSWIGCVYYPDETVWRYLSTHKHGISWRGFAAKVTR